MTSHVFSEFSTTVAPEWIDYNGHMNEAYYSFVLVEANEAFLDSLGLGAEYVAATAYALYTVESHLYFLKECREGETLTATSVVDEAKSKSVRVHTIVSNAAGEEVLKGETVYLHMSETGVSPLPEERLKELQRIAAGL